MEEKIRKFLNINSDYEVKVFDKKWKNDTAYMSYLKSGGDVGLPTFVLENNAGKLRIAEGDEVYDLIAFYLRSEDEE